MEYGLPCFQWEGSSREEQWTSLKKAHCVHQRCKKMPRTRRRHVNPSDPLGPWPMCGTSAARCVEPSSSSGLIPGSGFRRKEKLVCPFKVLRQLILPPADISYPRRWLVSGGLPCGSTLYSVRQWAVRANIRRGYYYVYKLPASVGRFGGVWLPSSDPLTPASSRCFLLRGLKFGLLVFVFRKSKF